MKLKNSLTLILTTIILLIMLSTTMYLLGHKLGKKDSAIEVTQQSILELVTDQYFIVSKTAYLQQEVRITIEENSDWSDLLWKDVIKASGLVRVDLGVDLSELSVDDIKIKGNTITLTVPQAIILTSSIEGEIEVNSERGLVTSVEELFEEEADDFNLTTEQLKESAKASITQEMYDDARNDSVKVLELILNSIGYEIVIK